MDNQNPIEPGDIAIYNKQPPRVFYRLTWKIHSSGPGMIQLKLPLKSARWVCLKGGDTGIPVKLKSQVNIAKKTRFRVVSGARELCTSSSIIAKFRDAQFQHGELETSSMGVLRRALSTGGQTRGRQQGDSIISVALSSRISSTNGDLPYIGDTLLYSHLSVEKG